MVHQLLHDDATKQADDEHGGSTWINIFVEFTVVDTGQHETGQAIPHPTVELRYPPSSFWQGTQRLIHDDVESSDVTIQAFHDVEVGEVVHHHWGQTITEADAMQNCHLTLACNPLYFDKEHAKELGHPDILLIHNWFLTSFSDSELKSAWKVQVEFLGVHDHKYLKPVYPGDTLTAISTTEAKRESESTVSRGVITWCNEGFTQHGDKVIEYRRSNLAFWKSAIGGKKEKKNG